MGGAFTTTFNYCLLYLIIILVYVMIFLTILNQKMTKILSMTGPL